jgi:chromosomal replication initiation ATPase DnaA
MVFAADRAPAAMGGLDERLRSRFAGGLVVEIQPPDDALRRKLFARRLAAAGEPYDAALVEYLASRPTAGAAEIEEMVARLVRAAQAAGAPLDVELARRELERGAAAASGPASNGVVRVATPSSSVVASARNGRAYDAILLDREKVVWEWPDVSGRAIEELR